MSRQSSNMLDPHNTHLEVVECIASIPRGDFAHKKMELLDYFRGNLDGVRFDSVSLGRLPVEFGQMDDFLAVHSWFCALCARAPSARKVFVQ